MKFQKGITKTSGRKKGTPNKLTKQIRSIFEELLNNNIAKIQSDLDEMKPVERMNAIFKLAEFVLPKLTSISGELKTSPMKIIIQDGTDLGAP